MWPGATRSYQVTAAGDLFNGAWFVRVEPRSGETLAGPPRRIAYEDRWCPIVRWTRNAGAVQWNFEAVAFPEPEPSPWSSRGAWARFSAAREREADDARVTAAVGRFPAAWVTKLMVRVRQPVARNPVDRRNLFVSVRATATNLGAVVSDARLALRCERPGADRPYWDADSLVPTPWEHGWQVSRPEDLMLGWGEGDARELELVRAERLRPGETRSFDVVLPAYPTARRELAALASVPHERRVEEARSYWSQEVARGASFDVPDPELRMAIRAARVLLLAARERRDVDWVPLGGPFHYRDVWVRDGARVTEALAVSGYTRESRELTRGLLRFQTPIGTFVSQSGQLDGTGQMLWALEQTMLRPSPAPEIGAMAGVAERAWHALEIQRAPPRGDAHKWAPGLLPVTDPHDAELVRAQLVGNDAWALVGYRATERMLRAATRTQTADRVARSRTAYLAAFGDALRRTGRTDVPPSWQGMGIDWGNLNVGYPCDVLDAADPRLASLATRYWARVGGPGLGYYGDPDSLHTYVAADLGTVAMLSGDRRAADRILDAMVHWRTASGGAAELFVGSTRDFGKNFPPHATAAAALLALVRNALVFDDGDTLMLALGARSSWWTGTAVRGAPTRWGTIDLRFAREGNTASWTWTPVPVWSLLTLPPDTRPATVPAPLRPGLRPDQVLAPPGSGSARILLVQGVDT